MANTVKTFANGYSIVEDHDGNSIIYIPCEIIDGEPVEFVKSTRSSLDRKMVAYKSQRGAENFLVKQGALTAEQVQQKAEMLAYLQETDEAPKCLEGCECDDCIAAKPAPAVETPEKETTGMTTKEITIYQQTNKNGVLHLYCEDCKPRGGKRGTLVVSGYDSFCAGCGNDLYEMAQDVTPEPPDDELSPSDLAAIREAMAQPDLTYTVEELTRLVEQNQQELIGRITRLKAQARAIGHDWGNVISHAVPYALRTYSDERLNHLHLDYIEKYLSQPVCFKCEHIHTNKECPRCHKPLCSYCEWGTLDRHINTCPECALVLRKEQEALQQAWEQLQSVPAYTARFARENVQVG